MQWQTHRLRNVPAKPSGQLPRMTPTNFDLLHLVQNIHAINDYTNNGVFACSQNSSRLFRFHDDLSMIAIIGTSDRLCWLAETCKILLLLLLLLTE